MKHAILASLLVFAASAMADNTAPAGTKSDSSAPVVAPATMPASEASKEKEVPNKDKKLHGAKKKKVESK